MEIPEDLRSTTFEDWYRTEYQIGWFSNQVDANLCWLEKDKSELMRKRNLRIAARKKNGHS